MGYLPGKVTDQVWNYHKREKSIALGRNLIKRGRFFSRSQIIELETYRFLQQALSTLTEKLFRRSPQSWEAYREKYDPVYTVKTWAIIRAS